MRITGTNILPTDSQAALLIGRVWSASARGPVPVLVRDEDVFDLSSTAATVSQLLNIRNLVDQLREVSGRPEWNLTELLANTYEADLQRSFLLAPIDLQVVKACGVTFVDSMVERVIEERCAGDPMLADTIRDELKMNLSADVSSVRPGTTEAEELKQVLVERGMWSQYLEVGLGPHPEVFTKAPVLSSVGTGSRIGVASFSSWNNPEPELVLVVDKSGCVRGCTLGNDVNLRDIEGRSALLLGMAKDNNASSAIGPFVRLFDEKFTIDCARTETITLRVDGFEDGYRLDGENNVARLSRTFEELVEATWGAHHQYPDGFALYTGTLFTPVQDRAAPGQGFTHVPGDVVQISSPALGTLINEVQYSEDLPPWTFGLSQLIDFLITRALVREGA